MQIIGLYSGILTLVYLYLCIAIVKLRYKHKVKLGEGDTKELQQAIRAQANFIEYVPLALVLIILLSFTLASDWLIHAAASVLVVARILHAIGLHQTSSSSFGRFWGTVLTWSLLLVLAITNISLYFIV
jgi:uncharacterized protein